MSERGGWLETYRPQRHGLRVMGSKDAAEGPRAFLEKRQPVFTGR